jgi:hypothetical protein
MKKFTSEYLKGLQAALWIAERCNSTDHVVRELKASVRQETEKLESEAWQK